MTTVRDFAQNVRELSRNHAVGPEGQPISENEFRFNLLGQYHKLPNFDRREIARQFADIPETLLSALEMRDYDVYRGSFAQRRVITPRPPMPAPVYIPPPVVGQGGFNRHQTLANLERMDRDLNEWSRLYQAAPAGSTEERMALTQLTEVGQRMTFLAADSSKFMGVGIDGLQAVADHFYQEYQSAGAGSRLEAVCRDVSRSLYARCGDVLNRELEQSRDFRYAESLGERYQQMYQNAPAGSLKESSARDLMNIAFPIAESLFSRDVSGMGPHQRFELVSLYNAKYQSAPAGGALERHYRQMKTIAAAF